jgi:hypothetical protein
LDAQIFIFNLWSGMCTDAGVKFTAWLACQIVSGKCTIATDVYGNRSRAFTYSAPGLKRDNLVSHLILAGRQRRRLQKSILIWVLHVRKGRYYDT